MLRLALRLSRSSGHPLKRCLARPLSDANYFSGPQPFRFPPAPPAPPAPTAPSTPTASPAPTAPPPSEEKMHIVFTCTHCETRSVKSFARSSYETGVVLAQCPGCQKRHVIADHLGWFGAEKNIEEIMEKKGVGVRRVGEDDVGKLGLEDVAGWGRLGGQRRVEGEKVETGKTAERGPGRGRANA